MRRILLATAVIGGLAALTSGGAEAAPSAAGLHPGPGQSLVAHVAYYWQHHHWRHRRWEHHHWRYYN